MGERFYSRVIVDKLASCEIDGRLHTVFLYDLSVGGCMAECDTAVVALGQRLRVVLNDYLDMTGKVAWVMGANFGLQFDVLLRSESVVALGFSPSSLPFSEIHPRDRFGAPLHLEWVG